LNIVFTSILDIPEEYYPKPSSKYVPDWYKNLESYHNGKKEPVGDGSTMSTIKKCMPVFDAITGGYIITTYCDVWVKQKPNIPDGVFPDESIKISQFKTQPEFEWPSFKPLEWHAIEQAKTHPLRGEHDLNFPKWTSPWSIKTPPGYSILFVQPMHRESVFTILPGIVDTDKYDAPVNFPFVLNNANKFEGLIPAGTPIAQVIPFKRDSWEMSIGSEENLIAQNKTTIKIKSKFFDSYKTQYRQSKEYI
jgi:hypothetical protein